MYRIIGSLFNGRRLGLLLLVFGVTLFAAAPAIAQVGQEFEEEDVESGDVEPVVDIVNAGDNVNFCAAILQSANTGNVQNQQGVSQYLAYADDIEFEGSSIEISPELAQECEQTLRQAAAAGAAPKAAAAPAAAAPAAAAKAGVPVAAAGAGPAGAVTAAAGAPPGGAAAKAGGGMLPKTGGPGDVAPLVAAAGLLLVGGGLLTYRRFFMQ